MDDLMRLIRTNFFRKAPTSNCPHRRRGANLLFFCAAPALIFLWFVTATSFAGSAIWNLNPTSGDWNTAANWTPETVPNGPADVATFAVSNQTDLSNSVKTTEVNSIVFDPAASAFIMTVLPSSTFTVGAGGIVNNSGITQNFVVQVDQSFRMGNLVFADGATAGDMVTVTNKGAIRLNGDGAQVSFLGNASAGYATLINEQSIAFAGGKIDFFDTSTAANGTFIDQGGRNQAFGGRVTFHDQSTAGQASFDLQRGDPDFSGASPGQVFFLDNSTAGEASFMVHDTARISFSNDATAGDGTFTVEGGTTGGPVPSLGGTISFYLTSSVGHATLTANPASVEEAGGATVDAIFADPGTGATFIANGATVNGANGGRVFPGNLIADSVVIANDGANGGHGGRILFTFGNVGGPGRVKVFGDGQVDISGVYAGTVVSLGSIAGNGKIFLGGRTLSLGSSDRSTIFRGAIRDGGNSGGTGGSLTKVGTGGLTLLRSSTYTGATTVTAGVLFVNNRNGSATGTGKVSVNSGELAGRGTIAGPVTIGTGVGSGALLSPTQKKMTDILTVQGSLTFHQDGTYSCELNSDTGTIGRVAANGVVLGTGQFSLNDVGSTALPSGSVFSVIANTSATPISGTFANLSDGATLTVGSNTFQASYSGGDGNDLTLTVVP